MIAWVSSFWSSATFTGPASNAPNNVINIKLLFDQRPKQVISLSKEEIKTSLKSLRKTIVNAIPSLSTNLLSVP